MAQLTESVTRMIDEFAKLPGIGRKSAERMAYHVLRVSKSEAMALSDSIRDVKQNVRYCSSCYHLSENELCEICTDTRRNHSQICVVEQPRDLMQVESSGVYKGVYHVATWTNCSAGRDWPRSVDNRCVGRSRSNRIVPRGDHGNESNGRGRRHCSSYFESVVRIPGGVNTTCKRNYDGKCSGIHQQRDFGRCIERTPEVLDERCCDIATTTFRFVIAESIVMPNETSTNKTEEPNSRGHGIQS